MHAATGRPRITPHKHIDPDRDEVPEAPPDPEASSPELSWFYDWCLLSGCRPIAKTGKLFGRRGLKRQYQYVSALSLETFSNEICLGICSLLWCQVISWSSILLKHLNTTASVESSTFWTLTSIPGTSQRSTFQKASTIPTTRPYHDGTRMGSNLMSSRRILCSWFGGIVV